MIIGRPKFVLASGSPRRLTLINQIGIEPDALRPADIDEMPQRGELPRACANRLARGKAEAALAAVKLDDELAGSYILAADTVVAVGRRILPKADLLDEAAQCLRLLVGPQPPRPHRRLPGDAEGGVPPAADRDAGALQAAVRAATSRPISPPANGAARPAATPRRGWPAASSSRSSAPTPTSSACRCTRPRRCCPARASRSTSAGSTRCDVVIVRPVRRHGRVRHSDKSAGPVVRHPRLRLGP